MNIRFAIILSISVMLSAIASAKEIKIGSGSEKGNYFSMTQDVVSYCGDELGEGNQITNLESNGSISNLVGMNAKKYTAGIVQEDVLQYYSKRDPGKYNQNRFKVIAGMHSETAHLLIPKDYSAGSWSSKFSSMLGGKGNKISIEMLKGQKLGAWGGSLVSAEALSYFFNLKVKIVAVEPSKAEKATIPLLLMAGQPDTKVQQLLNTGRFILVPIDYEKLSQSAPFYLKMDANYEIDGKVVSVNTFGIRALMVGKAFRKESRNAPLKSLAKCIEDSLLDLADDDETNPNWLSVYEFSEDDMMTDWKYFEI